MSKHLIPIMMWAVLALAGLLVARGSSDQAQQRVMPLESKVLEAAQYHRGTHTLTLRFRSGAQYEYYHVPRALYREFMNAKGKGSFFNERVRHQFNYRRVEH